MDGGIGAYFSPGLLELRRRLHRLPCKFWYISRGSKGERIGSLLKSFRQYCIGPYGLSHGDEVELDQVGDFVSHDDAFLALDRLLDSHLPSAKDIGESCMTHLERSTQTF